MHRLNFKLNYPNYDVLEISDYIMFKNLILYNKDKPILYKNDEILTGNNHKYVSASYIIYHSDLLSVKEDMKEAIDRIKYYIILHGLNDYVDIKQIDEITVALRFNVKTIDELKTYFRLKGII